MRKQPDIIMRWAAIMALSTVFGLGLVINKAHAEGFGVEVGLGFNPQIVPTAEKNWYSNGLLATVELSYEFDNRFAVSMFHMSDPVRLDPDYGINSVLVKYRVK